MMETGQSHSAGIGWSESKSKDLWGELSIDSPAGGLIIIGPSPYEIVGLEQLLALPMVEGVEVVSSRMMSWQTVNSEAIEVSRQASRAIRRGRTAVVYLDSHVVDAPAVPARFREFVCARLGQILVGLADTPAYVALHGERMASTLILDTLVDENAVQIDSIDDVFPVWSLEQCRMFPGLAVAVCPGDRCAIAVARMHGWFEDRRVERGCSRTR